MGWWGVEHKAKRRCYRIYGVGRIATVMDVQFFFKEDWICTTTIGILESLAPFRNTLYLGLYQGGYDKMYHIMSSRCLTIFRPVEQTMNYITEQIYV